MKRVLVAAAALATLSACGGTEPKSVPVPTIETSDTTTPLPTTTTPTTTSTTTPPPAPPPTEVPEVAPPPPAPHTPPPPPPPQPPLAEPAGAYYANCSEARAAGAAPLYRGEPGYRPALDRDDDGVACET